VLSFHSFKAVPKLLELPEGSAMSEETEGLGSRRRLPAELCQSWDTGGQEPSKADLLSHAAGPEAEACCG